MKAVQFHEHGGVEVLRYEDVETPKPAEGEVLVKVSACALNHLDIWIRNGIPAYRIPMPHISGCDVSGWVEDPAGSGLRRGQRVVLSPGVSCGQCEWCRAGHDNQCMEFKIFGAGTQGGYAQYCVARASDCVPLPDELGDEEAAAFPLTFVTAWHMLFTRANLKSGETVLVMSAGSGVGSAALQMARWAGARALATAGTEEKADQARSMGAEQVHLPERGRIRDWAKEVTGGRGVDVVFEHVGGETLIEGLASLSKNGRLVTCGSTAGGTAALDIRFLFMRQLTILGSMMGTRRELEQVLKLVAARTLRPVIDRTFPLSEAATAQRWMEARRNFGKILLLPEG
ncbi:MAG: hypothetical protein A3G34_07255 [Candidatus Lindowbacteria bacterium RIFCSPLOWO2_12_FULL_62_27]|nr:MAG: hypothetical protein A3I06_04530 [Candidatus Lindowbacteria bacterium RIFCSPLOWO2_02_FULL_62_12]OGH59610.1 MAG: hypothetical protein A3G34_07255 [Candidatus Lindowbacteria bacterium RIFCSPLOWO2_12_FULL_62_27]